MIITGTTEIAYTTEKGVLVVPIGCLKYLQTIKEMI